MVDEKEAERRHRNQLAAAAAAAAAEEEQPPNAATTNNEANCDTGTNTTEEDPTPASTTVASTSRGEGAGRTAADTPSSSLSLPSTNRACAEEEVDTSCSRNSGAHVPESDDVIDDDNNEINNNNRRTSIGSNTWMEGLQTLAAGAGISSGTSSSSAGDTTGSSSRPPAGLGRPARVHPAMLSSAASRSTNASSTRSPQRTNSHDETAAAGSGGSGGPTSRTTLERSAIANFAATDSIFDSTVTSGEMSTISGILTDGESVAHRATRWRRSNLDRAVGDDPSVDTADVSALTEDRFLSATGVLPLRPTAESSPTITGFASRRPVPSYRNRPGAYHVSGIDSAAPGLTTLRRSITNEGDYIDEDEIDMVAGAPPRHPATMMISGGGGPGGSSSGGGTGEIMINPGIDVQFVTEAVAVDDDVPVAARVVEDVDLHVEDGWNEDGSSPDSTATDGDGGNKDSKRRRLRWVASLAIMLVLAVAVAVAIVVGESSNASEPVNVGAVSDNASASDVAQGGSFAGDVDLGFFQTPPTCWASGYLPKCGQCWCAPSTAEDDGSYACPELPEWIINECTAPNRRAELAEFYRSFELASVPDYLGESPIMHLGNFALSNISEQNRENPPQPCDPYAGILEGTTRADNPHLGFPPCYPQGSQWPYSSREEDMVCAYKFVDPVSDVESCKGRKYDLVSYDSEEEANADGALVTHGGPCGFCSNAHDLASFIEDTMSQIDTTRFVQCRSSQDDFAECLIGELQLSASCGTWFLAFQSPNFGACRDQCMEEKKTFMGSGKSVWDVQGPPPACEPSGCLECVREYTKVGAALAGRNTRQQPGGIFSASRYYECSAFEHPKVVFDPCDGLV